MTDDGYEGEPVTADTLALATRLNIRGARRGGLRSARRSLTFGDQERRALGADSPSALLPTPHASAAQVRKLVAQARLPSPAVQGFLDVTDGLQVAGMRATMRISADEISCRTKTSIELARPFYDASSPRGSVLSLSLGGAPHPSQARVLFVWCLGADAARPAVTARSRARSRRRSAR